MNTTTDRASTPEAYSLAEERWNCGLHAAGILLGVVGGGILVALAAMRADGWAACSTGIFALSVVGLYTVSTLYHAARRTALRRRLKRLDHIAIYYLIAGTYTPLLLVSLRTPLGMSVLAAVWLLAMVGTGLKIRLGDNGTRLWSVLLYLGMGWMVVLASRTLFPLLPRAGLWLLLLGGLFYTGGILFYLSKGRPWMHAIWHGAVLCGTAAHFASIAVCCIPAA